MKLPLLKKFMINIVYNLILIIMDKFIKYAYFILYIKESGMEELVY